MKWIKRLLTKMYMKKEIPRDGETFAEWFERQEIQNFTAKEFTDYFNVKRRGVRNSEPPREMWPSILPTLRVVDTLRTELGVPCKIHSSYRSPAYNAAISGAAGKSLHMQFIALDITFEGIKPSEIYKRLMTKRQNGVFKGGLGSYPNFTHIDTRGRNATW